MVQNAFYKLFLKEISDLYSAEKQLVEALPKMAQAATTPELKEAFEHHLSETENQVARLENIFSMLNENPLKEKCEAMEGLIMEANKVIQNETPSVVKDAALIGAAQRVEHYEIAGYGVAKTFAIQLELYEIAELLKETLAEEGNADKHLTMIAEGGFFTAGINKRAKDIS
ncbi:ferritin-like domain-containing protein [Parachlamydia sp. AcF125]|uniref:ferritin-like domain-containing protein n=1 Tax=Parachlamydia sp. AcF125 TaxID=2795736 RepID=UPI001BC90B8F|nr:ferritin-like domain-containing protein [Parachlamydia sp. AcF125]MBS4167843.1 Protein YciF [Parachlamydia sp. AcF125]